MSRKRLWARQQTEVKTAEEVVVVQPEQPVIAQLPSFAEEVQKPSTEAADRLQNYYDSFTVLR